MTEIKKIIQNIYKFDLKNCQLINGEEMVVTESGNEFVNTFVLRDFDKGVIVTPSGYMRGLIYKSLDGGMFYNPARWMPDIITFNFNVYGLKKNAFYRLTIKAKNMSAYNSLSDTTNDRSLQVTNDSQELLINEDLSSQMEYKNYIAVFRASAIEENLTFRIGKIGINDIIIDEVEIMGDLEEEKVADQLFELDSGKSNIVGYGVFSSEVVSENAGRYQEISKVTGKGLNLYFDKNKNEYILERDNYEDTIGASFTNANFVVDFSFNKAPYATYTITDVSNDASPNTLKQGYIRFTVSDSGKVGKYNRTNGRFSFIVHKIL